MQPRIARRIASQHVYVRHVAVGIMTRLSAPFVWHGPGGVRAPPSASVDRSVLQSPRTPSCANARALYCVATFPSWKRPHPHGLCSKVPSAHHSAGKRRDTKAHLDLMHSQLWTWPRVSALSYQCIALWRCMHTYLCLTSTPMQVIMSVIIFVLLGSETHFSTKWTHHHHEIVTPSLWNGLFSTISFLLGATTSILSGYFGMKIATYANARVTVEARKGIAPAFEAGVHARQLNKHLCCARCVAPADMVRHTSIHLLQRKH